MVRQNWKIYFLQIWRAMAPQYFVFMKNWVEPNKSLCLLLLKTENRIEKSCFLKIVFRISIFAPKMHGTWELVGIFFSEVLMVQCDCTKFHVSSISLSRDMGRRLWAKLTDPKEPRLNPLSTNPTKWSEILKQFVGFCRRIVWVCLTILWGLCLKY